jgi:hypothetical protein
VHFSLEANKALIHLHFSGNRIGDDTAKILAKTVPKSHLRELELDACGFSDGRWRCLDRNVAKWYP